ncbi:PrgI family protein [Senegalia sp. (in: firmicutes)]|uniref:PrgI family protein n=1 Tax=Senegalia sp. (in: firmicutes) TaxID=1924098 RepID=UPI003F9D528B
MANNIIVPVPTELKKIKSELIAGLTKRQVVGFGITVAIVVPSFILLKNINLSLAMYGAFAIGVPFIFTTIFTKDKLTAEKHLKNILEHKVLFKEKRLYEVTKENKEIAIARGFISND